MRIYSFYPLQNALTSMIRKDAIRKNLTDFMSMRAGQNVNLCTGKPAIQLIRELDNEILDLNS